MDQVVPVLKTLAAGTIDTTENVFINVWDALPISKHWRRPIEPMNGKVCIITGANAGIGYATARKLAQRGAHVILACRSKERGVQAAQELSKVAPLPGCEQGSVEFQPLDLSSLQSVRTFAKAWNAQGRPLDVLVCNAGIMSPPLRTLTKDGLEVQFQVNFLAHWLLSHELVGAQRERRHASRRKGAAKRAANGAQVAAGHEQVEGGTRLVMLSSLTHHAGVVQWKDKNSAAGYSPYTSYGLSKIANIMSAKEFQRRFERNPGWGGDSAVSIHPGVVNTHLATSFFKDTATGRMAGGHAAPLAALAFVQQQVVAPMLSALFPILLRTPESSAEGMLLACTLPSAKVAGRYMHNSKISRPDRFAEDEEKAKELWDLACELTGTHTHKSLL